MPLKPSVIYALLLAAFLMPACKGTQSLSHIDASELTRQYYLYERRSDRWYYNQEIEVRGVLSQVARDKDNRLVIILALPGELYGVKCTFTEKESIFSKPLELNRRFTVRGICKGLSGHVILTDCSFVRN